MCSYRMVEEFRELNKNPITNCGITVGLLKSDSYKDWKITMIGPKDTPYKGGLFNLNVHFPDNYPNEPPEVYFITPIYHLNINPKVGDGFHRLGNICISTLNWWKPEYKMREVLHNIYLLFYCHNPDSAYGTERSKEYKQNFYAFSDKAKYFTKKYANPRNNGQELEPTQDWDFNM